jgi:hypothetical protein
VVTVIGVVTATVMSWDRGVADPVPADRVASVAAGAAVSSPPVVRSEPAPQAQPAPSVPDPRCRAARRLFLRAAIDPDPAGSGADVDVDHLLDQVEVMAEGPISADMEAVRELAQRIRSSPQSISDADQEASIARMERLLIWTMTTCPPPQRPVWGCAAPVILGSPDYYLGTTFLASGQLVPDDAVIDRLGEPEGKRIELARNPSRVVYAWTDPFGLVRRRVEVQRVLDLWFVTDARRCAEPVDLEHPLDGQEPIVEELPDGADGPEYAPTTTTTAVPGPTVPGTVSGCGYDPGNATDAYGSLGDYMSNGPGEAACWQLLSAAGRACVNEVTASAPAGNPDADELYACFDL